MPGQLCRNVAATALCSNTSDAASGRAQPARKVAAEEEPKLPMCTKKSTEGTTSHCGHAMEGPSETKTRLPLLIGWEQHALATTACGHVRLPAHQ